MNIALVVNFHHPFLFHFYARQKFLDNYQYLILKIEIDYPKFLNTGCAPSRNVRKELLLFQKFIKLLFILEKEVTNQFHLQYYMIHKSSKNVEEANDECCVEPAKVRQQI